MVVCLEVSKVYLQFFYSAKSDGAKNVKAVKPSETPGLVSIRSFVHVSYNIQRPLLIFARQERNLFLMNSRCSRKDAIKRSQMLSGRPTPP